MRNLCALLLAALLGACATAPDAAVSAARTDTEEFQIETTVLAVYNVISGPAGRRDWKRFEALFVPDARIVVSTAKDGVPGTVVMTTKDYIDRSTPAFNEKGFFERPIATRTLRYGNIAHVWSTYEAREASSQEKPDARGINSFELVRVGSDWKVQSLVWQKESAAHPIPPQFAR
ncbi:MAG TPA: hypothetical protein VFP80_09080 [Thermoanaerobaculia bacterium]|nr:hypothetical protein [Thermoanaerobaculia bacterium]